MPRRASDPLSDAWQRSRHVWRLCQLFDGLERPQLRRLLGLTSSAALDTTLAAGETSGWLLSEDDSGVIYAYSNGNGRAERGGKELDENAEIAYNRNW